MSIAAQESGISGNRWGCGLREKLHYAAHSVWESPHVWLWSMGSPGKWPTLY